jgi:GWxTD domain-containing protein
MKSKIGFVFFIFLFALQAWAGPQKVKQKNLLDRYKDFLNLTEYIMLPEEREVFMLLSDGIERDSFIETFWKQRDPTKGTPLNEYKEEHLKRFQYANKMYGRGTPRDGWMTDMGRIYIILGPPASVESFEATQGLNPTRVWYYYGDASKGLPSHFGIVFFQRDGAGEFKLYDPISDGPGRLLVDSMGVDFTNYRELYRLIMELAPSLADRSLSMIVGESPINFQPSTMNSIVMADIFESPKENISATYATNFLNYKGMVSTEYMTNFIECEARVSLIQDPQLQLDFVHVSIAPKHLTVEYYEPTDQYYCNFVLDVTLRKGEDVIYQQNKNFPMYFDEERYDFVQRNGIALEDSFPVVVGEFNLIILIQNSVGKEFSVHEQKIAIPERTEDTRLVGPFLGYKFENYQSSMHVPFKIANKKLVVDPNNTFSISDDIFFIFNTINVNESSWKEGRVEIQIESVGERKESQKNWTIVLSHFPFQRNISFDRLVRAGELIPDYYEMRLTLVGGSGEILDERVENFIVSPVTSISHPVIHAKGFNLADSFMYYYALANQYEKLGNSQRAAQNFEKAFSLNPDYKKGLIEYANFLFNTSQFEKILEVIERIKDDDVLKFEYSLLKGKALMGLSQYVAAIESLLEANQIYNSHIGLLNSLGFCYYKVGNREEAVRVLNASLSLDPNQVEVKKLLNMIEKDEKNELHQEVTEHVQTSG